MVREILVIALAIQSANPGLSDATRRSYAKTVQQVCRQHDCDPFTIVAMVEYESRWRAHTIGKHGSEEYVGLGQIRLKNSKACQDLASPACNRRRQALLNGHHNLKAMGAHITAARKYCKRRTGRRALFARWLAVYQGIDAARGTTCNQRRIKGRWVDQPQHRLTRRVIRRRAEFVRRFGGR